MDGLADLYEQGLVKGVGLSNYGPKRALGWQLDSNEIAELDQAAASVDKVMVQNIFQTK